MADIAETLGIHESTVSRAVSKKYLQCSWGVYPMNFFFSRNVGASASERSNNPAKEITAHKIKQFLHEIIEEENKKKPYSCLLYTSILIWLVSQLQTSRSIRHAVVVHQSPCDYCCICVTVKGTYYSFFSRCFLYSCL